MKTFKEALSSLQHEYFVGRSVFIFWSYGVQRNIMVDQSWKLNKTYANGTLYPVIKH